MNKTTEINNNYIYHKTPGGQRKKRLFRLVLEDLKVLEVRDFGLVLTKMGNGKEK